MVSYPSNVRPVILGPDGRPARRGDPEERPPLRNANGQPLYSEDGFLLPHERSFSAVYNAISRTYRWTYDEALKHNQNNALAMRRDVALLEMLRERQLPVAQLKWHLEPEDPKNDFQNSIAEDLARILRRTPRLQALRLCLLEAAWYGRYGVQLLWRWFEDQGRRILRIADWRPVNGDKIQYNYDGVPGIFVNTAAAASDYPEEFIRYGDRVPLLMLIPPHYRSKFIIHRHEIDDADYFEPELAGGVQGVGIRHRIYWLWWMRNEVLTWALDFLERIGAGGLTVFYYDASDPSAKNAAEKAAVEYDRNTALAWPRYSGGKETGSSIERIEPGAGNGDFIFQIVQYFDATMRRYVIGQSLSSQAESTGLGSGVSELHGDTKFRILKWDAENLDETLTTDLVAVAQRWNYERKADFQLRYVSALDKPEPDKQLDAVNTAAGLGVTFKAEEVRELTGLSKPDPDDEVIGGAPALPPGMEGGQPLDPKAPPEEEPQPFRRSGQPRRYGFDEVKHPRDKGKFADAPGGAANRQGASAKPGAPLKQLGKVYRKLGMKTESLWRTESPDRWSDDPRDQEIHDLIETLSNPPNEMPYEMRAQRAQLLARKALRWSAELRGTGADADERADVRRMTKVLRRVASNALHAAGMLGEAHRRIHGDKSLLHRRRGQPRRYDRLERNLQRLTDLLAREMP